MNKHHVCCVPISRRRILAAMIGAGFSMGIAGSAQAFIVDTGNPDFAVRLDTTVRYNLGFRMKDRDPDLANNPNYDESDFLFDKHDVITNRLDLLGEFDITWKGMVGARVSAAGWVDDAYGSKSAKNPNIAAVSYKNQEFTSDVTRYYQGPSGEFLDAFVFFNVPVGEAGTANIKLGRHAVVWGEGLFGSTNSVAYGQNPSDGRKSIANPGASAKETALPMTQFSAVLPLSTELTMLGQYTFDWKPNRLAEGGTFFAGADIIMEGPNIGRGPAQEGDKGDVGLALKWSPAWLDGTLGVYYRKFDDKGAWAAQPNFVPPLYGVGFDTRAVYATDVEILGVSLAKNIAGVSVAAELSQRRNGALTSVTSSSAGPAGRWEGARGTTWHGVLNAVSTFGESFLFNSASLVGELGWSHLDKVTKNERLYRAKGTAATCNTLAEIKGCADDDFYTAGVSFTPTWLQVMPGIDLSAPLFAS
ncbi:MAG: DUF1302 family protein, partial [Rhodocyclaceae bacterium]|nr:DUF1302 family protein [Rhodocyclaceae bacterium]